MTDYHRALVLLPTAPNGIFVVIVTKSFQISKKNFFNAKSLYLERTTKSIRAPTMALVR
jgi:hypothetical protein